MSLQQEATVNREATTGAKAEAALARLAPWVAWSAWALSIAFGVLALALAYANRDHPIYPRAPLVWWFVPALCHFPTVGAIVASRRPRNPIGWIFLSVGLAIFGLFAEQYAGYTLVTKPAALPGGLLMAWISTWTSSVGLVIMLTFTFLLFPSGHLPSPRWRVVVWADLALIVVYGVLLAITPGPLLQGVPASRNPVGYDQAAGILDLLMHATTLVFGLVIIASAVSLIERYLHARGEERQQLKWIAYAGSLEIVLFASLVVLEWFLQIREKMAQYSDVATLAAPLAAATIVAFPSAVGIAILRHHLFNIDLIISRTLVYVPLTAILAGLYAASITFSQKLFIAVTGQGSDAAIVLTTLALTVSFTPIKNWLQGIVDRRFKENPDPARKLEALSKQLRASLAVLDSRKVVLCLLDEAVEAFGAASGAIYTHKDGRMELAHTRGEWREGTAEISAPIKSGDHDLGEIRLGPRKHETPYTPEDRETLRKAADAVAEVIGPGGI